MSKRRVKKRKLKKPFKIFIFLLIVIIGVIGFFSLNKSSFFSKKSSISFCVASSTER